jgi:hypothetical protein
MPRRQPVSFFTVADRIEAVEQALQTVENEGKAVIELPTYVVRWLASLARRAPHAGRGRTPLSQQSRTHDVWTVAYASKLKNELLLDHRKQGKPLSASDAATLAAQDAKATRGSRLSVDEIVSRMNRRPGRARLISGLIENTEAWVDDTEQ